MEFRLLGPLEVLRDGRPLVLGGAKQRALLAMFLLHANEVVSRDLLLEELWGNRPPGTAAHSLDVQVSRLRKALEPSELLVTRAGGYVLEVEPERIDVVRFERLLEEGRAANAARNPARAAELLRQSLSLWRGQALTDFAYEPFARLEVARLDELWVAAVEERVEAELALGSHEAVIPELESLVAAHPLRERPLRQLMLALYRSGRQAEALQVYAGTRRQFVEELGLEPGKPLRELEQAILRQEPSLSVPPAHTRVRQRRWRRTAAAALAVAAAAAAAGLLLANGGTQSSRATRPKAGPNSVALVSERTSMLIGQASTPAPVFTRFGAGALWNVSFTGVLSKLDPATGAIVRSVNAVPIPCGLELGYGSVWVTDCTSPTLVRIDPEQVVVTSRFPLPPGAWYDAGATGGIAIGAGSVWVAQGTANPAHVYRLEPATGSVQARIEIPEGGAGAIAFGDGALWVGGGSIGRLSRIDPRTNHMTNPARDLPAGLCCLAAGGGYVWAAVGHQVWKLSPGGQILDTVKLAANVDTLRYADGAVWASVGDAGTVARIDASTDVPATYRVGHHTHDVDAQNGVIAVSVQATGADVTRGLKGRIVNIALDQDWLDSNTSTDPVGVQTWNAYQLQFHYATCAKLFNYPDRPGAAGKRLEPEVAAGWPKISDGGRTYTFTIRPGFGFSPPSHEQVTAQSFRHEIERVLQQPGPSSPERLADIVGAAAFRSGHATHVVGVFARGDTLVIRLVRPAGDLPTRLAEPQFCAVPAQLRTIPYGLPYPIRTAGPYYLADRTADVFVLKPNPNYHGPRSQKLDAIVYRVGINIAAATNQIFHGKIDYVQGSDPALAPGTAAARSAGYRLTPNNTTDQLALNARRPTFANIAVRRAVEYAVDRSALAQALNRGAFSLPTRHLLPPSMPGSDAGPAFPLTAQPDIARRLMQRQRPRAVYAAQADGEGHVYDPRAVAALQSQLAAIGIKVAVVPLPQTATPEARAVLLARADIAAVPSRSELVYDPVRYLRNLPYLPAPDLAALDRIAHLESPAREAAAAALAAKLERDALYVPVADDATPELVSKRLGCVIDQPEYPGVDLAALCLAHK